MAFQIIDVSSKLKKRDMGRGRRELAAVEKRN